MADAQIQDAQKAKEEAIAMKTEYEQNMQQAKEKASSIVTEAQKTASLQSEEILKTRSPGGAGHEGEGRERYCPGEAQGCQ